RSRPPNKNPSPMRPANTALLGAMMELGLVNLPEKEVLAALDSSFASKPALVEKNRNVYAAGRAWVRDNL
ncbi:MAG: hypothetical protein WCK39_10075, partial [Methanomassiliicoccales archaeon]